MKATHAWGLVAATALGCAAGAVVAPREVRRAIARRTAKNLGALRERYDRWVAGPRIDAVLATERLRTAIAAHATLGKRRVWVDAHGSTILLHGIVESDEEWRFVDRLARAASPDGSVRNLLQVRRTTAGG